MPPDQSTAVEHRIWDPRETISRDRLEALQVERLAGLVERVARVPFYRTTFAERGINPHSIHTLDDLRTLPFTTKEDLRRNHPLGLLTVPRSEVARIHGSSGTTGKPTFVAYTAGDLDTWSGLCARFLVGGGLRPEHTVHIAFGYGLFTGGFGLHYGIERVGAAIVPVASGNTRRQIDIIEDLQSDVLVCTPSYALTIAETARDAGRDPRELPLRFGHFGGEPWTEDMRREIENALDLQAFNNYGLSEIIGPGVSGECRLRDGMHLAEDHFLVECLDPDSLEPVPDGQPGELVITTLTKQAMPVIRYRTRDIATLDRRPCACGRTTARMSRVLGRSDDMLIIRGVNVFPSQIEEALLRVEGTAPHYLIEVARPGTLDQVTVTVELRPETFTTDEQRLRHLQQQVAREIQTVAGIRAAVVLLGPHSLERSMGKAKRVVDHRKG
jgi:phenylacetate-CoA ligase